MISDIENIFIWSVGHLYAFGEMSIYVLSLFLRWAIIIIIIIFTIELLESLFRKIKCLSDIKLEYIFSHYIGSFFTLLIVYFAVQKLLNLIYSNLAIFAFATCVFEKANIPDEYSYKILL